MADSPADADAKIPAADDEIVFVPEVERIVGAHHTSIRRWWRTGQFPAPLRIGPNRIGWQRGVIREWVRTRPTVVEQARPREAERAARVAREAARERRRQQLLQELEELERAS
jgi:predicted DNA-binding transcriptional regulator AlpA